MSRACRLTRLPCRRDRSLRARRWVVRCGLDLAKLREGGGKLEWQCQGILLPGHSRVSNKGSLVEDGLTVSMIPFPAPEVC